MSEAGAPRTRRRRRPLVGCVGLPVGLLLVFWARVACLPLPVGDAVARPDPAPGVILAGAFHVHTTESDGRGDADAVVDAAISAGLQFVFLADHDVTPPEPRIHRGVVLVPGTELSTSAGHLIAAGADTRPHWRLRVETPVAAARTAGGVAIVAHPTGRPRPWTDDLEGVDGLEILNLDTHYRDALIRPHRLVPALAAWPVSATVAVLSLVRRPDEAFALWDGRPDLVGVCGHNAHGYEGYVGPFEALQLRLRLDAPLPEDPAAASAALVQALGQGAATCTLGALLDPGGFRFHVTAGEAPSVTATLDYEDWPRRARPRIVLFRDGAPVGEGEREVTIEPAPPGWYRAEVHLNVPWIAGRRTFPWIFTSGVHVTAPTSD